MLGAQDWRFGVLHMAICYDLSLLRCSIVDRIVSLPYVSRKGFLTYNIESLTRGA